MAFVDELIAHLSTLKAHGESFERQERLLKKLAKDLERSERKVAELEKKLSLSGAEVFDALDERWCFANNVTIQFESTFEGGRRLRVAPLIGKRVVKTASAGKALLKVAVEEASARTRPQQQEAGPVDVATY